MNAKKKTEKKENVTSMQLLEKFNSLVPELFSGLKRDNGGCIFAIIGFHRDIIKQQPVVAVFRSGEDFIEHRIDVTTKMYKSGVNFLFHLSEVWMADTSGDKDTILEPASKAKNRESGLMFSLINPLGGVECGTIFRVVDNKPEKVVSVSANDMVDRKEMVERGALH